MPVIGGMIDLGTTAPRGWAIKDTAAIVTLANQTSMSCTSAVCSWLGVDWIGVLSSPFPTFFLVSVIIELGSVQWEMLEFYLNNCLLLS